ncbi:MAG: hypothetical protein IPO33_03030 [Saprospiraceae bacterium]|nr:hypothetical protein [Candidatus Brachybacter algidus]
MGHFELQFWCFISWADTHIVGYIKNGKNQLDFNDFMDKVRNLFKNDDLPELINQMHSYFGAERFGFSNLFQDEKINLLKIISKEKFKTAVESFQKFIIRISIFCMKCP